MQQQICNDNFDKELYMAKTYWEPQLADAISKDFNIDVSITTKGKIDWDLEINGQPYAELKCQKLKNVEGVWIKGKFYQNELMVAELTGLDGDKLGHFFHIPEAVKYYVIGLISKYDEKHVEYFYWFNWQLYRQNIINILQYEYGSNWYELICNNKIWTVDKDKYKIIEQMQKNGKKKWIVWIHNVFDLCTMDIQQWGLLKSHVKKPQILKNIA